MSERGRAKAKIEGRIWLRPGLLEGGAIWAFPIRRTPGARRFPARPQAARRSQSACGMLSRVLDDGHTGLRLTRGNVFRQVLRIVRRRPSPSRRTLESVHDRPV